jgi:23S rRNA (pseudouridine1915-N3)-methyltransferase
MNILIAAIGRARSGPEQALFENYSARLAWKIEVKELEIKKELAADVRKVREGELLMGAIPDGARVVALDERGKNEGSAAFATKLGRWRDDGVRAVAFLIGGADGLDETVRKRADLVLSLGAMTWPHLLVRGLLAEQIYRAHCILSGHPYHRA